MKKNRLEKSFDTFHLNYQSGPYKVIIPKVFEIRVLKGPSYQVRLAKTWLNTVDLG
jgi:hypothetical protein